MSEDLFSGIGILVDIIKPENFNLIRETLTRIGVCNNKQKILYQSCHIVHKKDDNNISHYVIANFKELFILDGKKSNINDTDLNRLYFTAVMLESWGLLKILDDCSRFTKTRPKIKILSHSEKHEWTLIEKYSLGKRKETYDDY